MVWFFVDDTLAFHRKVVRAGNAAMGLWVRAGSHCAQQLTDGVIEAEVARTMGKPSEIQRLVDVGLWEQIDSETYRFHDYLVRNRSRVEVEESRDREREKKARWRAGRAGQTWLSPGYDPGDTPGDTPGDDTGDSPGVSPATKPSQSIPSKNTRSARFDEFWSAYPRKVAKDAARRAWDKAVRRADVDDIIAGLQRFRFSDDPQFIPHPATWLNQGRWQDQPSTRPTLLVVGDGATLTKEQIEDLIGPDHWRPPPCPDEWLIGDEGLVDDSRYKPFVREAMQAHRRERFERAMVKLRERHERGAM